jgi:hypothetical protein
MFMMEGERLVLAHVEKSRYKYEIAKGIRSITMCIAIYIIHLANTTTT